MSIFRKPDWRQDMQAVALQIDDDLGGELLQIIPTFRSPNQSATPDYASATTLRGIFDLRSVAVDAGLEETTVSSRNPVAQFAYANIAGVEIKAGYWIKRCATNETYEVTQTNPDGVSALVVQLVQLGKNSGL